MKFQLTYANGTQITVESDTSLAQMQSMYAPSVDIIPLGSDSPADEVSVEVVETKSVKKRKAAQEANDK